jgi:hypothetical protein
MGLFKNIKSAIDDKSSMSVNSISVLASAFMTVIIGLSACFVIIYDVTYDGKVDTDMSDLAWFVVASSTCILGSGLPKAYTDSRMKTRSWVDGEKLHVKAEEDIADLRAERAKKRNDKLDTDNKTVDES